MKLAIIELLEKGITDVDSIDNNQSTKLDLYKQALREYNGVVRCKKRLLIQDLD